MKYDCDYCDDKSFVLRFCYDCNGNGCNFCKHAGEILAYCHHCNDRGFYITFNELKTYFIE